MNEILNQRIQSVKIGKDITHAQIVAKRNLREELDQELEKFLANGSKVQVLPIGFSHFKDGTIPLYSAKARLWGAMSMIKRGDRVKVDFISESASEFSGKHFIGEGVVDRCDDGYVFGRLDDGQCFGCPVGDAQLIELKDDRTAFEAFFKSQTFYLKLRYSLGDRMFDFDAGIGYRNLTVQVAYVCWCKGDKEFVL